jgi:GNAT superfamily N-acetyltransferase
LRVVVRRARPSDQDALAHTLVTDQQAARMCSADGEAQAVLVAEVSGEIVGFAAYDRDGSSRTATLLVETVPEWRRRGIARVLIGGLASTAWKIGIRTLVAGLDDDDGGARRLLLGLDPEATIELDAGHTALWLDVRTLAGYLPD